MNNHHNYTRDSIKLAFIVIPVIILQFLLCLPPAIADNVITSGATVRINSGIFYTTLQNVEVENGGGLTIEGSLILKNNLTNLNTVDNLGTGTIEFSGTTPQSISGNNTIGSLRVNNAAGLDVAGNTMIDTLLNLQNGHIRLGTNNLALGDKATISGTPSASSMVIATGTGELRKSFTSNGNFTFPVGDNTGTAEYSPVILQFTSGTFAPVNYAGVKLTNSAYPGLSVNSLNRYWALSQNGISGLQYNAIFQYSTDDISENERNLSCVQVDPTPIVSYNPANTTLLQLVANGLTSSGIFTGDIGTFASRILGNYTQVSDSSGCFGATQTITIAGGGTTVTFESGSTATLIAGQTIFLLPGFYAYEGSFAHAWITTDGTFCDGASGAIVENPQVEKSGDADANSKAGQAKGNYKSIKVYPNPNNGKFTITLTNIELGSGIAIYNALGVLVYQSLVLDATIPDIELAGIRRGLYFVKVTDGKEQITRKMIID